MLPLALLCVSWLIRGGVVDQQEAAAIRPVRGVRLPEDRMSLPIIVARSVGAIRVVKSLDDRYGLDEQAVQAAARWLFEAGTVNGAAVATRVTIILDFRLH